jgi:hypothetical protein
MSLAFAVSRRSRAVARFPTLSASLRIRATFGGWRIRCGKCDGGVVDSAAVQAGGCLRPDQAHRRAIGA